ncbi:integrating conjugative element protein [Pseudomonas sp. NPDC088368]|uniref:integrating conjugative element protein n=1 Tax=Pseudomonas sp. NPDC088368 TaxID=3364453 RepID=UPI0038137CA0
MNKHNYLAFVLGLATLPAIASQLVIVDDKGGTSALPYYRALNPQGAQSGSATSMASSDHANPQGFPVISHRLTPARIQGRAINAPGLQPLFIIGDDELSRSWLLAHEQALRNMQAVGLVVNVATAERFGAIQRWINGVHISPASGDDLAQRLNLSHYPALITATAIEQ